MAIAKVILNGETQMDVTQKTVTSATMLSGTTALKNDGTDITGNIASKSSSDLTVSGATVTAPSGYYASSASKSVASGTLKGLGISYNSKNHFIRASGGVETSGYIEQQSQTSEFNTASYLPTQAAVTIVPTETEQTAVEQYKWTTGVVKVGAIPSTYVGSDIPVDPTPTANGATVTIPTGYYSEETTKSVASGTAGTPTATKGTVSNHSVSITPSVTNTTGYITGGTKNGTAVSVSASELVSGTKTITESGETDVTNYASASVAAGSATTPTTTLTANPTITVGSDGLITATASASKSVTPTVSAGYISSGTAGSVSVSGSNTKQLTTQGATTIAPSTTDQVAVSSGTYVTGDITVNAVTTTNLTAENIAQGVTVKVGTASDDDSIASITGTHQGGSITVNSLSVTQNGTYTAPSGTAYSPVTVNVEGGSSSADKKQINFIDYDGTIVESYTSEEWANVSELPANPSHSGLVAQGWNWTKAQIDAQLSDMPDGEVWIGQMYITSSGKTEIDISLENPDSLSPYLTIPVNGSVTVDWGDGTSTDTVTGTSLTTLIYTKHDYATTGNYTISILVNSGSFTFYSNSNVKAAVLSAYGTDSNRRYSKEYSGTVEKISIGSGITSFGSNAFCQCYALQSITIPSGVTSIGTYTFQNCYSLQSVTIPSGVTSFGSSVFSGCYSLQSVTIPSGVTSIGTYTFQHCYALQYVTIPSGVTSIGNSVFSNCYSLQSVTIPSGVTSIANNAFQNCYSLQPVTIPSGVTSIGSSVFSNCYALQSITIPSGVTSIGQYLFNNCYSLQSITIPSGVTSIGNYAFQYCSAIEEYHLLPTTPPTLGSTNSFSGIVSGTVIYVPSESLEAYQTATNWSTYASYMQGE